MQPRSELDEKKSNEKTALLKKNAITISESNQVFYNAKHCQSVFFKPYALANINNATLALDTVIGIAASASNEFDEFIQKRASLVYIPIYLLAAVVVPLILAHRTKRSIVTDDHGREELKMKPEEKLILSHLAQQPVKEESVAIKVERQNTKIKASYLTHVPVFMLSLAIHLAYVVILSFANEKKDNWFVQNFDWLGPTLMGSMMLLLSVAGKYGCKENQENRFEERINNFKLV